MKLYMLLNCLDNQYGIHIKNALTSEGVYCLVPTYVHPNL